MYQIRDRTCSCVGARQDSQDTVATTLTFALFFTATKSGKHKWTAMALALESEYPLQDTTFNLNVTGYAVCGSVRTVCGAY